MVETQLAEDASVRQPLSPRQAAGFRGHRPNREGDCHRGRGRGGEDLVIDGKVDGTIELPHHVLTVGPWGAGERALS